MADETRPAGDDEPLPVAVTRADEPIVYLCRQQRRTNELLSRLVDLLGPQQQPAPDGAGRVQVREPQRKRAARPKPAGGK